VSDGTIDLVVDDRIARLVLNRPAKLNSITFDMSRQLFDHIDLINRDRDIRVVIMEGAGDRAFSAGSDLKTLDEYGTNWEMRNRAVFKNDYIDAIKELRKPMIAQVDGIAYGGGLELACIADIRLATPRSSFAAAEIKVGWHAGSGQTQYLPRMIGTGNALRLLLTGDPIDGTEAHRVGLVQFLCEPDELEAQTLQIARRIGDNAPIAVQLTKHLVRHGQDLPLDVALRWENDLFAYVMATADAQEGQLAFKERRPPVFKGE
jgi:enoyl-CoA hydratase